MLPLTTLSWRSNLSKTAWASLSVTFAVACGSSSSEGSPGGEPGRESGTEFEGAAPNDGASLTDDGTAIAYDSGSESGSALEDGTASDDGTASEGGNHSPLAVNLGAAASFAILAKSGVSTVPTSVITGDVGVSPAAATYLTGFSLTADPTNVFSTSLQVTGHMYASDYAPPTPSNLTAAIGDMQLAFTDAAGRPASVTELGAGNAGGMTLPPKVYQWSTGLLIPTTLTLSGTATDIWIFQVAQDLTLSSAANVVLTGGAVPKNVFWQVAGSVDIGTTAHFEGVLLAQTSVALHTGASVNGRLLAQTAVNLESSTIVEPAP